MHQCSWNRIHILASRRPSNLRCESHCWARRTSDAWLVNAHVLVVDDLEEAREAIAAALTTLRVRVDLALSREAAALAAAIEADRLGDPYTLRCCWIGRCRGLMDWKRGGDCLRSGARAASLRFFC